jgi:hypothetical protein
MQVIWSAVLCIPPASIDYRDPGGKIFETIHEKLLNYSYVKSYESKRVTVGYTHFHFTHRCVIIWHDIDSSKLHLNDASSAANQNITSLLGGTRRNTDMISPGVVLSSIFSAG